MASPRGVRRLQQLKGSAAIATIALLARQFALLLNDWCAVDLDLARAKARL
jgi:hypothetical protein